MNYKKAFDILENLYISLSSEYQNTINEYSMDFKQSKLDEIDEIYESIINKLNK